MVVLMFLCLGRDGAKSVKTGVNSVHMSQQFCVAKHCHFEGVAAACEDTLVEHVLSVSR
jgi:hypothetical protein